MATVISERPVTSETSTVVQCYDLLHLCLTGGVTDFTDGKYVDGRDDRAAYLQAQSAQAEYLLDEIGCGIGTRILDIGCGYGRILEHAERHGAKAVGITISPPQVEDCQRRGLDVRLLNYRDIPDDWNGQFDGIVANGSLEHFAQLSDAMAGRVDEVYEEMFAICYRLLARGKRFVTTAIHFREAGQMSPEEIALGPDHWPVGSDQYQFAMVQRNFGGWYPEPGQLAQCAAPHFRLTHVEDGTDDYRRTSEFWLRQLRWSLATRPRLWRQLWRTWRRQPQALRGMLRCLAWDQSWMWQFRGQPAPMALWRQTWLAQ